jgi:hypothetical protein
VLGVVDETVGGDATVGAVGTDPMVPTMGDTVVVGTAGAELTPRLLISIEPNGISVRAPPPDVVGGVDVGVDDEATLLEPAPHIPDNPDVSSIPEDVDIPDVAEIPGDVDVPDVAPVAGVAVPVAIPIPIRTFPVAKSPWSNTPYRCLCSEW